MKLVIDTTEELSAQDLQILSLLTGGTAPAAAAPKVSAKKTATPDPEPAAEEDLVGGDAPTMADAVALATKLVSAGQSAKVKEALADTGAKRVSELSDDAIAGFVAALSD